MNTAASFQGARSAQYVGARVQRREDRRLLCGDGQFVDDLTRSGMLHAAFLRSTFAHARIRSIDVSDAARQPGVVAVFTGADLASWGVGPIVTVGFLPDMPDCAREPLPTEKIRHVGEAIAVVVAESRYIAEDACELIRLDVERLPAVVDPETALQADAPLLHEEMPSNLVGYRHEVYGDPRRVFAEADHVFKKRFVHGRVAGVPIETRGVVGEYDRRFRSYTIWSATQVPHLVRSAASASLGVSEGHVRVIAPDVGGGFGIKAHPFVEEVVIPAVAKVIGAPVKWTEDRYEHLAASVHAKELVMDLELAVASDGTFLAMRGSYLANSGAYACFPQTGMVDSMTAATLLPSLYRVEHVEIEIRSAYTNKCMTGTYRGVGWCSGHTAREALIDDVARALGRDPVELRLQNFIPSEPYTSAIGMHYDGGSYHESVRVASEELGYEAFRVLQAELRKQGRYVGIGFSPFVEPAGIGTAAAVAVGQRHQVTYDWGTVTVEADGTVAVRTAMHSHGQGHETTFAQLTADQLGLEIEDVRVVFGDTEAVPYGTGTFASRSAVVAGGCIIRAAGDVREKIVALAAHMMEVSPEDVVLAGSRAQVLGAPETARTMREIAEYAYFQQGARAAGLDDLALTATRSYDPPESYSNGTIGVIVEVDVGTGEVAIERTVAVEDCGVMLNPMIVAGQVAGGVAQGIGGALYEDFVYDATGNFLSGTLADYLLPSTMEVGEITVKHLETPSPVTEGGIKGMGEAGTIAAPAAVLNAVADALASFGASFDRLPITPTTVIEAVTSGERGRGGVNSTDEGASRGNHQRV